MKSERPVSDHNIVELAAEKARPLVVELDGLRSYPIEGDAIPPVDADWLIAFRARIRRHQQDAISGRSQRTRFALDARIDAQIGDRQHDELVATCALPHA